VINIVKSLTKNALHLSTGRISRYWKNLINTAFYGVVRQAWQGRSIGHDKTGDLFTCVTRMVAGGDAPAALRCQMQLGNRKCFHVYVGRFSQTKYEAVLALPDQLITCRNKKLSAVGSRFKLRDLGYLKLAQIWTNALSWLP
jgi:hypothetical protein